MSPVCCVEIGTGFPQMGIQCHLAGSPCYPIPFQRVSKDLRTQKKSAAGTHNGSHIVVLQIFFCVTIERKSTGTNSFPPLGWWPSSHPEIFRSWSLCPWWHSRGCTYKFQQGGETLILARLNHLSTCIRGAPALEPDKLYTKAIKCVLAFFGWAPDDTSALFRHLPSYDFVFYRDRHKVDQLTDRRNPRWAPNFTWDY